MARTTIPVRRSGIHTRAALHKEPAATTPSGTPEWERVKWEPKEATLNEPQHTTSAPSRTKPPSVLLNRRRPWKHPDELEYIKPDNWDEDQIIGYLCKNGFSIPPRLSHAQSPWCEVTDQNGDITIVPRGYRLPLMFAAKFQWESLRLVMTSAKRNEEWDDYKFDILHVSRLCNGFLEQAKAAMGAAGMDRMWRCPMFDRALTRYYRRWLVNREDFVRDFWLEYKEEEYERDILKGDWVRFVLKGHKGFSLTRDEINNGITFDEFTRGLSFIGGRLHWETNHNLEASRNRSHAAETAAEKAEESKNPPPPLTSKDAHNDSTPGKTDVYLSPTAITIKLEQMVDNPNFFRRGLSKDHEIIDLASTPDFEQPPSTATDNHTDDATTTGKSMDVEPTCTRTTNPDDLYVSIVSAKVVEPISIAHESVLQASDTEIPEPESIVAQHPEPVGISSANIIIPEVDPDTITMDDSGVSVEDPPVVFSQDIEMGNADETSPPEEEDGDKDADQNPYPDPVNHNSPPPAQEPSLPLIPPLPFSPPAQGPPSPLLPLPLSSSDTPPTPLANFAVDVLPIRTVSAEPQRSELVLPPDVEMSPPTSQTSRPLPRSESSQSPSRFMKGLSEQPSPSENKLSAWDARVQAALQRVQKLGKPVRPVLRDRGVEGVDEPVRGDPSTEVEPNVNENFPQQPVELPQREATPKAQSPTLSRSSTVAPTSSLTAVSPEGSTDVRSEVAAGKARQVDPEPPVEEVPEEDREAQSSAEPVQEPAPPALMEMEIMDAEPTSISQAPRAWSRRPEPSEHAFDPNVRDMSLSSVSTYRCQTLSDEGLQSDHDSGSVVRQVMSLFRETLSGVLDSLEQGTTTSPTVHSRQFMSVASTSASASVSSIPDSPIVGELLDEIRSLKQQMREDAVRRLDRDLEVQRLQSQVDDLRRHVQMMDSQSQMSVDVEDEAKVPESPSTSYSTFSPQVPRHPIDPGPGSILSSHPLAHLFAMDLDDSPPTRSRAGTTSANGSPWSTPDISTPVPCLKPSAPHDAAPLPIKSQRKHRMMFFPPPKQP